jgi:hypothetical protein
MEREFSLPAGTLIVVKLLASQKHRKIKNTKMEDASLTNFWTWKFLNKIREDGGIFSPSIIWK